MQLADRRGRKFNLSRVLLLKQVIFATKLGLTLYACLYLLSFLLLSYQSIFWLNGDVHHLGLESVAVIYRMASRGCVEIRKLYGR
jgi:hypothetical protein